MYQQIFRLRQSWWIDSVAQYSRGQRTWRESRQRPALGLCALAMIRKSDDHVAVALAAAQIFQLGDDMRLKPGVALAPLVGLVLIAHAAKRERGRNRVERGLGNRDLDHAAPHLIGTTFELVPPVRNCPQADMIGRLRSVIVVRL